MQNDLSARHETMLALQVCDSAVTFCDTRQLNWIRGPRYCSRECQKTAWKQHKHDCLDITAEKEKENNYIAEYTIVKNWADAWIESVEAYALFAANLANKPEDFLKKHGSLSNRPFNADYNDAHPSLHRFFVELQKAEAGPLTSKKKGLIVCHTFSSLGGQTID